MGKSKYDLEIGTPVVEQDLEIGPPIPQASLKAYQQLIAAGLSPEVAMEALRQLKMDQVPRSEWDQFTMDHPYQAATKKLLVTGGRALARPAPGIDEAQSRAEKVSAAKMLREYLMAQDQMRANEAIKGDLWHLASVPGTWQSGVAQVSPGATPEEAMMNNQTFVEQDNAAYAAQNPQRNLMSRGRGNGVR